MPTPARKVSLINVADYPREKYSAHWHIVVSGGPEEGYRWQASLSAYKPVGYEWQGKTHKDWPAGAPKPDYPPAPNIVQAQYLRMSEAEQAKVRAQQEAWREACAKVYEAHPKARYLLEETVGAVVTTDAPKALQDALAKAEGFQARKEALEAMDKALRDMADTAAQTWVKGKMAAYRIKESAQAGHALTLGPAGMIWESLAELVKRLFGPLLMALSYSTTVRDNRLNQVVNAIDGGAGAGLLRIYDGTRPSTCGTATTLLAEITFSDPCATVSAQVLTFDNTPALTDSSANATGTATWHRMVDSTGTCCVDGNCGTSGSDINFNSVSISSGQTVTVSSYTITAGNA
jgi:hypothetical protein